jgi:hypothetical protein
VGEPGTGVAVAGTDVGFGVVVGAPEAVHAVIRELITRAIAITAKHILLFEVITVNSSLTVYAHT